MGGKGSKQKKEDAKGKKKADDQNDPAQSPPAAAETAKELTEEEKAQKKKFAPIERTLAIIKPDAMANGLKDDMLKKIEDNGFTVIMSKDVTLSRADAEELYAEHRDKPFFNGLCEFMSSGTSHVAILSKVDAMKDFRKLMGPTNPEEARKTEPDTFRAVYGSDTERNCVHGSETAEATAREIDLFFPGVSA